MINKCLVLLSVSLFIIASPCARAHEGHDHAPGETEEVAASGPISITPEASRNLGLKVEAAEVRKLEKNVTLIGQIEAIPNRLAAVTSRISGRISALMVSEGEHVKPGQPLVEVESRQPGEPPPRVKYSSPIDGVVIERHAVLGDAVEPDRHLMEIADLSEVYAQGKIFEGQVPWIKVGQRACVTVESYAGKIFNGTVELMGGALDPSSRTLKVWVRIPNPDRDLRPNMRATLSVVTGEAAASVAIPRSAVLGDLGQVFVYVQPKETELTFEKRPIVVGINDDHFVEVIEGVFPGDRVVTAGNYQLQYIPGTKKSDNKTQAKNSDSADPNCSLWQILIGAGCGGLIAWLLSRRKRAQK